MTTGMLMMFDDNVSWMSNVDTDYFVLILGTTMVMRGAFVLAFGSLLIWCFHV